MEWLDNFININSEYRNKLIYTVIIVTVIAIIRWGINKIISSKVDDVALKYRWRKVSNYLSFLSGIIFVLPLWLKGFQSLMTFLGLFSAGLAIALRDLLSNLVGWLFIIWKRPFTLGDRIQIGEYSGDVIDIRIFQFSLVEIGEWVQADQSTGRVLHIPNGKVLNTSVANYTAGFEYIWNEIPVLVTFESNWEKARQILLDIVSKYVEDTENIVRKKNLNRHQKNT
ncbi:mechanosensitive ion channel family protein [Halothermothrix orenii]|uniref:MscS Mechanosensitive ion channel n=1 Tax=Halothermothrix orenii (strain H 168 / OCM 544 / DSM 9562) TaxID=373903 RepID=B8CWI0_HALOH|nr:mechanosensitive ion channel domain-containing protein [Halothermothrix orenii]ACL69649.1 MscS Mechanosensitive ion channel [Halothermothrix orenii H 168]